MLGGTSTFGDFGYRRDKRQQGQDGDPQGGRDQDPRRAQGSGGVPITSHSTNGFVQERKKAAALANAATKDPVNSEALAAPAPAVTLPQEKAEDSILPKVFGV